MLRRKAEVFAPTDGMLSVLGDSAARDARGADFSDPALCDVELYPLAFRRMRISTRDVELAGVTGSEVTAKVEVRCAPLLTPDHDVLMGGKVYEVTRVEDRGRTRWLWLSEMACDGTCELFSDSYTYDALGVPHPSSGKPVEVFVRRVSPGLKRVGANGVDALGQTLSLRLRASDYGGEDSVRRAGVAYTVTASESCGRWVDLTCRERGADRGR